MQSNKGVYEVICAELEPEDIDYQLLGQRFKNVYVRQSPARRYVGHAGGQSLESWRRYSCNVNALAVEGRIECYVRFWAAVQLGIRRWW